MISVEFMKADRPDKAKSMVKEIVHTAEDNNLRFYC